MGEASQARLIEAFRTDLDDAQRGAALSRFDRAVAMLAHLYDFPAFLHLRQLTEYLQGRRMMAPDEEPLGGWFLMRTLSDPSVTTVSPNVDTLYGAAYLLLDRQGPVVLTCPAIDDRYWSVALMDAWFSNFALIGTSSGVTAGGAFLIVPPGWGGEVPEGIDGVHESPTASVFAVQRIYATGPGDYAVLHALQDQIALSSLDNWRAGRPGFEPVGTSEFDLPDVRSTSDPFQFFSLMNAFTAVNQPPHSDARLVELFTALGVGPGCALPTEPAKREAIAAGVADAKDAIDAVLSNPQVVNGWRLPDPTAGRSDAPILLRAATQMTQMGLLRVQEATYYFAFHDSTGSPLDGSGSYDITFEPATIPPVHPLGFWSVTMYGPASLLVANEIDRYLVRPDTPGLERQPDGGLTIRVQASRPDDAPPGNWLPCPASGSFNMALRIYQAKDAVLDGTWRPPKIVRLAP